MKDKEINTVQIMEDLFQNLVDKVLTPQFGDALFRTSKRIDHGATVLTIVDNHGQGPDATRWVVDAIAVVTPGNRHVDLYVHDAFPDIRKGMANAIERINESGYICETPASISTIRLGAYLKGAVLTENDRGQVIDEDGKPLYLDERSEEQNWFLILS